MRLIFATHAYNAFSRLNFPFLLRVSVLLVSLQCCQTVLGHGRLMEPPNRSSIFRFPEFDKYEPEKNWDDNELWCGGLTVQYKENEGKCGPCGDNYKAKRPRQNENGGLYGRRIIVRNYKPGQTIRVDVELTQYHKGHFEFSLCPLTNDLELEEEECFTKYPLALGDGSGFRYQLPKNESGWFNTTVKLPPGLSSPHSVLRWHYRTGNRWDWSSDNHNVGGLGNGDQEIFRGCADISIGDYKPNTPRPPPSSSTDSMTGGTGRPVATTPRPISPVTKPTTTRRPGTTMITPLPPRPTPSTGRPAPAAKPTKPSKFPKPPMQHPPKPEETTTVRPTTSTAPSTIRTTTIRPTTTTTIATTKKPVPATITTTRAPSTAVVPSSVPTTASTTKSPSGQEPRPPPSHPMMRPPAKEAPKNKQYFL